LIHVRWPSFETRGYQPLRDEKSVIAQRKADPHEARHR
jgi:hypothetical protein